ncbi:hypothetical protein AB1Y20_019256 [Prymnesium parvum]|uniref:Deleted in lung and esophageal cancer protein 1 Ig-like domain-containing protein n=1 Tax=Prymnesium parvum TaxID=97485 RepID=A0AB34JS10_PRYPA
MSVRKPLEAIFAHLYTPPSEDLAATPTREEVTVPSSQEVDVNTQAEGGDPPSQEPAPEAAVDVPAPAPEVVRDEYDDRIGNITANLEQTLQLTKAAAQHLNSARQLALEHDLTEIAQLDQLHGREHRKTGLPPGEPLLALDPSLLDEHGLLRARDLLKEVQEQAARRSAQPGGGLDILAEEASSRPQPHFMLSTRAFDAQLEARQSLTATVRSLKTLREQSREKQLTDVKPRVGTKLPPQLTMEEQQENIKVLRRMHGPLGFMRNPRYVLPPRKPASEAAPMPLAVPRRDTFIHVIPETINFVDYEAGGVYEIPVMLQNASSLARRVRVLPPASKFFSITLLSYPSNEGHIAPGMHASMRVRFAPDSLADYEDFLVVQTEMDSFPLPLHACRTPPLLTLPATLECGCCFVGGKTTITFSAKNEGGAGRFYIADKERWDSGDREIVASLCTEAFQVTPTLLDLQPGDEFTVSVTFTPPHATPFLVPLLLVCDNCRVKEVRLAGIGCITSLQLESIDGLAPQGELPQQETIDFGEVGMYTKHTKILRLLNETPLPVDFEWDHFALPPKCAPLTRFMGDAPEKLRRSELIGPLRVDDASTEYPFSISPRHGSLAAGEAATFELSFEPHVAQLWSTAIMLSTLNIPASAMPGASSLLEVGLRMFGRGVGSDLEVIDMNGMVAPALLLQGGSQIFKEVPVRLLLRNPNESTRAFRWVSDTAPVDDTSQSFLLDVTPSEGVIEGGGTAEVTVCMCGTSLGMLRRTLNFESTPHGRPIKLPLELLVVGPQVMIRSRCLDYGLLPLGESRTQMLEIENLSDLPAKFMLTPAALPNSPEAIHAAKAQAAVVGSPVELEDNALCDPIKDWAWVDNEVDANHKETELALLHRFAGIEPARCIGEVPGESITQIPVTLRPGAEQSLRRNLSLRVMHGQTAYVGVRAEVVQRKATLNLHELHLGTTYLRLSYQLSCKSLHLCKITRRQLLCFQLLKEQTCKPNEKLKQGSTLLESHGANPSIKSRQRDDLHRSEQRA